MSDFNSYQRSASKTAIYPDEHRILDLQVKQVR